MGPGLGLTYLNFFLGPIANEGGIWLKVTFRTKLIVNAIDGWQTKPTLDCDEKRESLDVEKKEKERKRKELLYVCH
jgi:hypothetical protein